eukprot:NODE_300_length_10433_cov_0.716470.p6 type:complete len:252 gc:universal NODE_300_length_10433_cov_0.716470:8312-7557(-)
MSSDSDCIQEPYLSFEEDLTIKKPTGKKPKFWERPISVHNSSSDNDSQSDIVIISDNSIRKTKDTINLEMVDHSKYYEELDQVDVERHSKRIKKKQKKSDSEIIEIFVDDQEELLCTLIFVAGNNEKAYRVASNAEIGPICQTFCKDYNVDIESLTIGGSKIQPFLLAKHVKTVILGVHIKQETPKISILVKYKKQEINVNVPNPLDIGYFIIKMKEKFNVDKFDRIDTADGEVDTSQTVDVEEGDVIYLA